MARKKKQEPIVEESFATELTADAVTPQEEQLPDLSEKDEELSAQDGAEAFELPYDAYRYRWEVNHRDERRARKKMQFRHFLMSLVAVVLALGFVALVLAVFFRFAYPPKAGNENFGTQTPAEGQDGLTPLTPSAPKTEENALSVPEIIEKVAPSVVCIEIDQKGAFASGVIVDASGAIITNRHVVADAKEITVYTHDGKEYVASKIGSDELSDIAVLRIRDAEGLVAAELGDSDLIRRGSTVVAIGTPGNLEFAGSATCGIVSGTSRRVQMKSEDGMSKIYTVIQTDAAINPGNSGGPLVNAYGEVIGITSMKLSSEEYESIGFALPINGVREIYNQIITSGSVSTRPENDFVVGATYLGAKFEYFSALEAEQSGLVAGAYVKTVDKGGPAETAGLKMGDIITVIDSRAVNSLAMVSEILSEKQAGDVLSVTVYRNREHQTMEITLSSYMG